MQVPTFVLIAVAGAVFVALFDWFVRLERRGDRHTMFLVLAVVLLAEAILAGQAANVPPGILRPAIAGQDFRPPDFVIVAILGARLAGRAHPGRVFIPRGVLPWVAFGLWYLTSVVLGLMNGYPAAEVLFQGKALLYLFGAMLVAGGADLRRLPGQLRWPAFVLAAVVLVSVAVGTLGLRIDISTPFQRFLGLGRLSNDSVSILTVLGGAVLLVEAMRPERRRSVIAAGTVLLLSPIAAEQRASYVVLAGWLVAVGLVGLGVTWRRRSRVTPTEIGLGIGALLLLVSLALTVTASPRAVTARFDAAFAGTAEANSARARFDLAANAIDRIKEHPIIGSGAGTKVLNPRQTSGPGGEAAAHNIILDMTMRSGLVGLVLLTASVAITVQVGARRWRDEPVDTVAAIVLAAVLGMLAVLEKAMVEPALDKFRLSTTLGICIGLVLLAGPSTRGENGPAAAGGRAAAAVSGPRGEDDR